VLAGERWMQQLKSGKELPKRRIALAGMTLILLASVLSTAAFAGASEDDSTSFEDGLQLPVGLGPEQFIGVETDPAAAEALPHDDLARTQAAHLLEAVFEESLDAPAGIYDELEVESFHSDHVAVVAGEESYLESFGQSPHRGLLQSVLPLRTENDAGERAAVDLDLEQAGDGELQAANPLVEVSIPGELGEGISLPQSGIDVRLAGAPAERAPSVVDESAAFYPNVAEDSDFTVVATPTGFETFSQLRTPEAPLTQTYEVDLPSGASLLATPEGGARVARDGETLAMVAPPTAIDAEGEAVPVSLAIDGSSLIVTAAPAPDSAYPILVDPTFESYYWSMNNNTDGIGTDWVSTSSHPLFEARSYGYGGAEKGLNIYSYGGPVPVGTQANWNYHVPRFYSDQAAYGVVPTSFINRMILSNVNWWIEGESQPYKPNPFVMAGLWDSNYDWWAAVGVRTGTDGQMFNATLDIKNPNENTDVKEGGIALAADNDTQSRYRHLWVGQATVELSDKDTPSFGAIKGPSKWVNGSNDKGAVTEPIEFTVSDPGLGIFAVLVKSPKAGGGINQWEITPGCPGNFRTPCPRTWKGWEGGFRAYNPKLMPQGENMVEVIGKDPVWHFSDQVGLQAYAKVKVDRTAPTLALSGSLTQQASLGTWLPSYTLKMDVADGTEAAPQSGAAKVVVKVDGSVVYESAPGCTPKNCAFSREWTMDADDFTYGTHQVEVIATDAVGMEKTSSFYVQTHGDQTSPTLVLSGSMTQQASLGTTRPSYKLNVSATDPGSSEERKSGVVATTIKVDGNVVDSASPGCPAGGCSISREWTLNSDSYSVGPHTVEVKATDEAGRSTTKTLTIWIARDNTAPQLTATTALYTAPEGWLDQKAVSYLATAADSNGYGVTSIALKIDGSIVKEVSGTCPAGNCTRMLGLGQTIDMSSFDGGAHPAELIATDGAGNAAKRKWTINVNPDGAISVSEAEDTLEALDETSPVNTVGESESELEYEGTAEGMELLPAGETFVASGSAAPTEISAGTAGEVGIEVTTEDQYPSCPIRPEEGGEAERTAAEEEALAESVPPCESAPLIPLPDLTPVAVEPTQNIDGDDPTLTDNGAAVVAENVAPGVDLVTRPLYDGAMTFAVIRDSQAPDSFSWEVSLEEDQELKLVDPKTVQVHYSTGPIAFAIIAAPAHDAVGTAVPTRLSVAGNVITLTVEHKAGSFTYPVVGGAGWEGGFQTYEVVMPPPEADPEEGEVSESKIEGGYFRETRFGAPEAGASADEPPAVLKDKEVPTRKRKYNFHDCRWLYNGVDVEDPGKVPPLSNQEEEEIKGQCSGTRQGGYFRINWAISLHGWYRFKAHKWVWIKDGPKCDKWGPTQPALVHCTPGGWSGPNPVRINVVGDYRFGEGEGDGGLAGQGVCHRLNGVIPNYWKQMLPGEPVLEHNQHVYWEGKYRGEKCDWDSLANQRY
jgi:hypothetical protein